MEFSKKEKKFSFAIYDRDNILVPASLWYPKLKKTQRLGIQKDSIDRTRLNDLRSLSP